MNPTEQFLDSLFALLERHEKETGTRIMKIDIKRLDTSLCGDIRRRLDIQEIKLEMV